MSNIFKNMLKIRKNLGDHLDMLKTKHKYYPEVVLDVGVADGTPELYEAFAKSHFILFEPLEEYNEKMKKIAKNFSLNKVDIEMCALGSKNEEQFMNVHGGLPRSSLCKEVGDENVNGVQRKIDVKRLDSFIQKYDLDKKSLFLKVDVQGFEIEVLKGAEVLFPNIDVIVLEVSFFGLYDSNAEFYDVVSYMYDKGYVAYDIFGLLNRPIDDALLQVDISFVKKESIFRKDHRAAAIKQIEMMNEGFAKSYNENISNQKNFDFSKQLNKLSEKLIELSEPNYKYLIYGAGVVSDYIYFKINKNVVTRVDRNSSLIDTKIKKDEVYSAENIKNIKYDKIIISVLGREEEIVKYLTNQFEVDRSRIIILDLS